MTFTTVDSLKKYLIEDQYRATISPVRFINVETMVLWNEVKKVVLSLSNDVLLLSDYCEEEDTTPNIKRVLAQIKKCSKSLCVVPFSEYLRVNPDSAETTIKKILTNEYTNESGKVRIYILMYRMKDILRNIPDNDPRHKDTIIYLDTSGESDYSLTIIQKELNVSLKGNEIYGFKKYLQYWELNPDKPIILHTQNAIYFEDNSFFDNVLVIASSYNLLKYRYNIPAILEKSYGDKDLWNRLAKTVTEEGDFDSACKAVFKVNRFNYEIYENWDKYDTYMKWLLWLWTKSQGGNSYTILCAKNSKSYNEFQESIFINITDYLQNSHYNDVYKERKHLLNLMKVSAVPEIFWTKLKTLKNLDSLRCLTDNTDIEKKAILELLKRIGYDNRKECILILKTVFPDLAAYLGTGANPANMSKELCDYFSEYKWLKITNEFTGEFNNKVKAYAEKKGEAIYSLEPRSYIVSKLYDDHTGILFIDGMGAEYIDYLSEMFSGLSQSGYSVDFSIGYCHLPSITDVNKDFLNNKNVIQSIYSLDELKHANCEYPSNILQEFIELNKLKDIVLNAFNDSIHRIIVSSDHGTSRLAVLIRETIYDKKIKPEGREIYRYGRYCKGVDLEKELPTAINHDNEYLIFGDYTRFEQKGAPADEIHGGASIEEWLVPVVCIDRTNNLSTNVAIEIIPITLEVEPEIGTGKVTICFKIKGKDCNKIYATTNGQKILCNRREDIYSFDYVPLKGENEINVVVSETVTIGKFKVNIKRKISTNKKFDI